jgi:hypothetical protein
MIRTLVLSFIAGVLGANALPHFLRGIIKRSYPNRLGNSPVPNYLSGWVGLVLAGLLLAAAQVDRHPLGAFLLAALGVLPMGLFHAWHGAFGKPERTPAAEVR